MNFEKIPLASILFLDIETVPQYEAFSALPEKLQLLWEKKAAQFRVQDEGAGALYSRAGIYAEFGKIICISIGVLKENKGLRTLHLKSFHGEDEKIILNSFCEVMAKFGINKNITLCAHNGKEFDFPYMARRMLVHGIRLPDILNIGGKKPWEVQLLDTMELWKFGDYKHYTSLELLTTIFDIESPKDDIDGSRVASVYWEEKDLPRIVSYCEKDVAAIAQLFLAYRNEQRLDLDNIRYSDRVSASGSVTE